MSQLRLPLPNRPVSRAANTAGFTLLEVLIAVVVIAIGLLGVAGMEALSLSNTSSARTRGLAAVMAASLSSAMSANPGYWAAGLLAAPGTVNVNVSVSGGITGDTTLAAAASADCTAVCTPVQLAAYDLTNWGKTISQSLPSGTGQIVCTTTVGQPVVCTITVSWSEKTMAAKQNTGQQQTYSYQTVVQP
ncbi:type IV pilus modification protein PilV [Andreprevotia chitinilytica]|uniref:type IV pilus modification protein PilV n=1 Tax=Andreprevotia chitinilytica TaxID=396808 RepID=UPI00146FD89F|nr:type IV pilus modification protein PilV [Andreprevotia chitinilytica]